MMINIYSDKNNTKTKWITSLLSGHRITYNVITDKKTIDAKYIEYAAWTTPIIELVIGNEHKVITHKELQEFIFSNS